MAKLNMVQAINLALHQEMERDDDVLVLGQDVGVNEGVFRVTAGLRNKFGERRVIDTPLAEAGIAGTALGMCFAGLRPVAEMQFSGFAWLAFGQVEANIARYRSRTQGQRPAPLVIRMPYGGGVRALEHHSESREHTWATVPGLKTVIPSSPRNARALLAASIRDDDPVVFMEPKHSYRAFKEEVPDEPEVIELGRAQVVEQGDAITVVSWGALMPMVKKAVAAAREQLGVSIELIDLLTISPLDSDTVIASLRKTGRLVIVQEAPRSFSVSSELTARVNDEALDVLEAPVRRVTHYDVITPYFQRENAYMPNRRTVVHAIEQTLAYR